MRFESYFNVTASRGSGAESTPFGARKYRSKGGSQSSREGPTHLRCHNVVTRDGPNEAEGLGRLSAVHSPVKDIVSS